MVVKFNQKYFELPKEAKCLRVAYDPKSVEKFGAKVGLLQAREHAIPFYNSQGWEIIDVPYEIGIIGPHRSMMKYL